MGCSRLLRNQKAIFSRLGIKHFLFVGGKIFPWIIHLRIPSHLVREKLICYSHQKVSQTDRFELFRKLLFHLHDDFRSRSSQQTAEKRSVRASRWWSAMRERNRSRREILGSSTTHGIAASLGGKIKSRTRNLASKILTSAPISSSLLWCGLRSRTLGTDHSEWVKRFAAAQRASDWRFSITRGRVDVMETTPSYDSSSTLGVGSLTTWQERVLDSPGKDEIIQTPRSALGRNLILGIKCRKTLRQELAAPRRAMRRHTIGRVGLRLLPSIDPCFFHSLGIERGKFQLFQWRESMFLALAIKSQPKHQNYYDIDWREWSWSQRQWHQPSALHDANKCNRGRISFSVWPNWALSCLVSMLEGCSPNNQSPCSHSSVHSSSSAMNIIII